MQQYVTATTKASCRPSFPQRAE